MGVGGFIISTKKMGQCIPSSETSEMLWKKSNVFRKISDVFWKKSNVFQKISHVFGKKSHVFAARSEVETLVGGFWGANAGQKDESCGALGEKLGGFEGEVPPFSAFQSAQSSGDVRFMLKYVRNKGVNSCLIEGYEEIGEGCESKKYKIPVGRAHAHAREREI